MGQTAVAGQLAPSGELELVDELPILLAARLRVRDTTRTETMLRALREDPDVVDASVERRAWRPQTESEGSTVEALGGKLGPAPPSGASLAPTDNLVGRVPNDTGFFRQAWHYNMIDAPRAWLTAAGSANVIVAVIDAGIKRRHPALASSMTSDGFNFVSADTIPLTLCSGGRINYVEPGFNASAADPTTELSYDAAQGCYYRSTPWSHGTHVAGTIAANATSAHGGVGIASGVRIRSVRVLNGTGWSSNLFDLSYALLYAAGFELGTGPGGVAIPTVPRAQIINMSIRWPRDTLLERALAAVVAAGTLVVACAGNDRLPESWHPASAPGVLSVSSMGLDWELSSFSNIGTTVSLAAPGGEMSRYQNAALVPGSAGVYSSAWNYVTDAPTYAFLQGTSMAAPHVAGVAALVMSVNPGLSASEVSSILIRSATDMGTLGRDDRYGYGVVNAHRAVQLARAGAIERPRSFARVVDANTGATVRSGSVADDGSFAISGLPAGQYSVARRSGRGP